MDSGREWTRRSIEELIEDRLRRFKGQTGGGAKALYPWPDSSFGISNVLKMAFFYGYVDESSLQLETANEGVQPVLKNSMDHGSTGHLVMWGSMANLNERYVLETAFQITGGLQIPNAFGYNNYARYAYLVHLENNVETIYSVICNDDYDLRNSGYLTHPIVTRSPQPCTYGNWTVGPGSLPGNTFYEQVLSFSADGVTDLKTLTDDIKSAGGVNNDYIILTNSHYSNEQMEALIRDFIFPSTSSSISFVFDDLDIS